MGLPLYKGTAPFWLTFHNNEKDEEIAMNQEICQQVCDFAKSAYKYDGEVTAETTFAELGKGSMKMIALTSMIENELDAEVPIREVMTMKTVGELVERVEEEME